MALPSEMRPEQPADDELLTQHVSAHSWFRSHTDSACNNTLYFLINIPFLFIQKFLQCKLNQVRMQLSTPHSLLQSGRLFLSVSNDYLKSPSDLQRALRAAHDASSRGNSIELSIGHNVCKPLENRVLNRKREPEEKLRATGMRLSLQTLSAILFELRMKCLGLSSK